jgi:molecular chaperone DnaK
MALQRLKEAVEKAKMELSSSMETEVNLPFITADANGPKHLNVKITRSKLESLVSDLIDRLEKPCLEALKDANLTPNDIREVIVVGGMTRMPAVQERVKKIFNKEPNKGVNPDEVVALGSAIQGAVLKGDIDDVLLLDVTPLSIGIETLGGVMTKLIEKNTTIPSRQSQIFSTAEDNQPAVSVHVLQGEREMAVDNKSLGQFELTGISPAPRSVPQIEVTFDIDADGIVNVAAKDKTTGKEQSIQITSSSGLSKDEIDNLIKDAELHSEADQKKRELIEARNSADSMIYQTEKMITEGENKIDTESKSRVEEIINHLKEAVKGEETSEINRIVEELTHAVHAISQTMYGPSDNATDFQTDSDPETDNSDDDVIDAEYKEVA